MGTPDPLPSQATLRESRATDPDSLCCQGEGRVTGCDSQAPAEWEKGLGPWAPRNGRQRVGGGRKLIMPAPNRKR